MLHQLSVTSHPPGPVISLNVSCRASAPVTMFRHTPPRISEPDPQDLECGSPKCSEKEMPFLDKVDPALLFPLERTYLSSLNHSFYLMLLATGFVMINRSAEVPARFGVVIYGCAILNAAAGYATHWWRIKALQRGLVITTGNSLKWLGALTALVLTVAVLDFAFIFVYPVLDRAKPVELVGADVSS